MLVYEAKKVYQYSFEILSVPLLLIPIMFGRPRYSEYLGEPGGMHLPFQNAIM
jgi:hypothetical protein